MWHAIERAHHLAPATRVLEAHVFHALLWSRERNRGSILNERRGTTARLLEHEQHPNVCAAAIDVLAEVGTRDAVPALQACAERFAGMPFLPFAVSIAIARISDTDR